MAENTRVALVTGASAGIGQACADLLSRAGWAVTGASRRGTSSGGWPGLVMDVDDDTSVRDGVRQVMLTHGRIDAVVAAAGWGVAGAVEHTTVDEAKAQFETNFWGCVRLVQAVLPAMRAQRGGRIVLISSIGGVLGIPFQAFYSASKFALEGLGESLAYEVAPFGIDVTLVQPGNVRTDFTANRRLAMAAAGVTDGQADGMADGQADRTSDGGTESAHGGVAGGVFANSVAGAAARDPVYGAAVAKAVGLMERDEANGVPPDDIAVAVRRILDAKRPPRRVSVGKASERVAVLAKRVVPFRLFEAGAKSSLGVG
jgi:NAD(P)-dependent dehydrogenase (short-subunit alcohol dehydrogenase family)